MLYKVFEIALKDVKHSLKSTFSLMFMFGLPLLVTGMFYLMFGNIGQTGEFDLPRVQVVVANLDEGRPRLRNVSGDFEARTLGELVIEVLQGENLEDLIEVAEVEDAETARQAVDSQQKQVALIIPSDFSHQFADSYEQAVIEFYQDPTLTIGPEIVKSILRQFMDGMAGINIAVDVAMEQAEYLDDDGSLIGIVVQQYLADYLERDEDLSESMLTVMKPGQNQSEENENEDLINLVGYIMGGMMIFYAFYTGAASAESILREEEGRTLQRLFTTPTPQVVILSGKFLSVFLTVAIQIIVLLLAASLVFGIEWGAFSSVTLTAIGIVFSASTFGILINSLLKNTKQGSLVFGGLLTVTGMIGMIRVFAMGSPAAETLGNSVSLLVPQGWALRGLLQAMDGAALSDVFLSTAAMFGWSILFFGLGVWRFSRRYS